MPSIEARSEEARQRLSVKNAVGRRCRRPPSRNQAILSRQRICHSFWRNLSNRARGLL
jgi:hypothetical protein